MVREGFKIVPFDHWIWYNSNYHRTYSNTLYIAHDNFDEIHAFSHGLAELCVSNRLTIFIQKTNSNSSQITFILIEGCFNINYSYSTNFAANRTQITLCSLLLYCSRVSASFRGATLSICVP